MNSRELSNAVATLLDIWDDGCHPKEHRTYAPRALSEAIETLRAMTTPTMTTLTQEALAALARLSSVFYNKPPPGFAEDLATIHAALEESGRQVMDKQLREAVEAAERADWHQVVLNGGPPCFHIEDGRFCFRAKAWGGHGSQHNYVTLPALLRAQKPTASAEERWLDQACKKLGYTRWWIHGLSCRLFVERDGDRGYIQIARPELAIAAPPPVAQPSTAEGSVPEEWTRLADELLSGVPEPIYTKHWVQTALKLLHQIAHAQSRPAQ